MYGFNCGLGMTQLHPGFSILCLWPFYVSQTYAFFELEESDKPQSCTATGGAARGTRARAIPMRLPAVCACVLVHLLLSSLDA